jgi:hypothetical protein
VLSGIGRSPLTKASNAGRDAPIYKTP